MVNVINAFRGVMNIDEQLCWSDSLDALHWIKNENKRREVFVENRTRKIRQNASVDIWRYCPTNLNAADIPSRGLSTPRRIDLEFSKWVAGPDFIKKEPEEWPFDRRHKN